LSKLFVKDLITFVMLLLDLTDFADITYNFTGASF